VASDTGFLAMDLDALNRPDLSDRLIATYVESSGFDLAPVLDFYRCYRAIVRGKVASFRLGEPDMTENERERVAREARRYFHLAQRYAAGQRGPRLIVMSGLTGTGKSTLARALAEVLPADVIDSDTTRKRLAGLEPGSRQEPGFEGGIYSREMSNKVYEALLDRAATSLARGSTVILDATYLRRDDRQRARELARDTGARLFFAGCDAPQAAVRERLEARSRDPERVSDGRWEIYTAQRKEFEPFDDIDDPELVRVDTLEPLGKQLESVLARLEQRAGSFARQAAEQG
jgi:predicted kinase